MLNNIKKLKTKIFFLIIVILILAGCITAVPVDQPEIEAPVQQTDIEYSSVPQEVIIPTKIDRYFSMIGQPVPLRYRLHENDYYWPEFASETGEESLSFWVQNNKIAHVLVHCQFKDFHSFSVWQKEYGAAAEQQGFVRFDNRSGIILYVKENDIVALQTLIYDHENNNFIGRITFLKED